MTSVCLRTLRTRLSSFTVFFLRVCHWSLVIGHWSLVIGHGLWVKVSRGVAYFLARSAISCHAFKLGISSEQDAQCSEQDAKPAAWLRLTHYKGGSHYWH
ncbi:MAG: hypothetical protein RID53_13560 [Coleofasciculus sp. B1-GNL1-01]|uniref:hypothetical protein n=1 Tax=Coleofasciculus sp. B1-GNL1-01 TaxID=3068484 RepID=UPI0032FD411E